MADIHPGSFVGDSVEEFKKLPTWGKIALGLVVVAVGGIAIYEHNLAASSSTTPASTGAIGSTSGGGSLFGSSSLPSTPTDTTGVQSPFSLVPNSSGNGSSPLIPFGDTPLFDALGNLIGWQQPNPNPTVSTMPPATPPVVQPPANNPTKPPAIPKINSTPLVPSSLKVWMGNGGVLYQGTSAANQTPVNLGKNSGIRAGSNGRYWVFNSSGQQLVTNNFGAKPA